MRYGRHSGALPSHLLQFSADKRPVVVWNVTRRCNLKCVHCYAQATATTRPKANYPWTEGSALLDDLKAFGVPVVLFSGGEPLMHPNLLTLVEHAVTLGMRAVISTNGTLIDRDMAGQLKGHRPVVRGDQPGRHGGDPRPLPGRRPGPLPRPWRASATARRPASRWACGSPSTHNYQDIPASSISSRHRRSPGSAFTIWSTPGRGSRLVEAALSHEQTRAVVDLIIDRTADLFARGKPKEVLTVDNHADGPYLYLRLLRENTPEPRKFCSCSG